MPELTNDQIETEAAKLFDAETAEVMAFGKAVLAAVGESPDTLDKFETFTNETSWDKADDTTKDMYRQAVINGERAND